MRKRILSFLLALSMVVSLLPAGAFAQGSSGGIAPQAAAAQANNTVSLRNGVPTASGGDGWTYENGTLTLTSGTYDFQSQRLTCNVVVESGVAVANAVFSLSTSTYTVTNHGAIRNSVFFHVTIDSDGTIADSVLIGNPTEMGYTGNTHTITVNGSDKRVSIYISDITIKNISVIYTVGSPTVRLGITEGSQEISIETINGKAPTEYDSSYSNGCFTVNNEDIVLNKTSAPAPAYRTELVMNTNGKPDLTNVQQENGVYIGDDWTYAENVVLQNNNRYNILTLTGAGSYDFSKTHPKTSSGDTLSSVAGRVVVGDGVTITGGYFRQYLVIESGGTVENCSDSNFVTNNGTIKGGVFSGTVRNNNIIENGLFKNTVKNNNGGTINGGVFYDVENAGTINGGFFKYGLNNDSTNFTVNGGYFNNGGGNSLPTDAKHVTVQNGKIRTVCGENSGAGWNLYVMAETEVQLTVYDSSYTSRLKIGSITGATSQNPVNFTTESDGYTITFTMPDEDVVLAEKTYRTDGVLVMDPDTGLPKVDDMKPDVNGKYQGTGWTYDDSTTPGKLTLTSGDYDFTKTGPATHSGSELKEVNCEVVVGDGVTIEVGTFNETVTNHGSIEGGIFVKGLSDDSTNESGVTGGYFRTRTGLPASFYSLSVDDGKIIEVNSMTLPGGTDGWEECFLSNTYVIVTADVGIATINDEKIGSNRSGKYDSYYDDGYDLNKVCFEWLTTEREDIVLGKAYRTELVMKADGTPDTDGVKQNIADTYVGDGWSYKDNVLTLTSGSYDFTNTNPADGSGNTLSEVDCEVVVEYDVTLKGGTFNKKVTNGGTIEDGTFKGEVENNFAIRGGTFEKQVTNNIEWCAINDGTFKEQVINNGVINDGTFKEQVINNGVINGGTFKEQVINNRVINNGIFVKGLSEESTNADGVYDGYFGSGTKLPEGFYSITVPGGKITEINNQDLTASVPGGWEKCFLNKSNATVTADVGIATINDEKIGSGESGKYFSDYVDSSNKKIYFYFTSGVENIVLGKIYDAPLVMKWDGYPDVTRADNVNGVWYGDGWNYDENTETLTLTGGTSNNYYRYFDLTIRDGGESDNLVEKEVRCKVVVRGEDRCVILDGGTFANEVSVEKGAGDSTIQSGVFNEKVTVEVDAKIENGTFNAVVENHGTIISNIGDFNGEVINDGTIKWGVFNKKVTNTTNGTINGGHFYSTVENEGTIIDGLFFKVPTGEKMTGGALALTDEEAPADAKNITIEGEGAKISALDSASVDSEKLYAIPGTEVEVLADTEITNLNGKKIGDAYESNYGWVISDGSWVNSTKCVDFTMPDEDVVLNKAAEPAPKPEEPKPEEPKAAEYTIKVDEYAKVNGKDTVTVKEGDTVSLTVSETPDGQTFDYWDLPSELQESLTKQDSTFNNKVQNLSFRMPKMGDKDATFSIKTGFRSAELPGDEEGPSALGTAAIVAVGGATAGVLVWQGVSLGVDSYLQLNLPDGVAIPTNRRELVKLLWETAGKPEVALPALYSDISAEEAELQKASRWAVANGLVGDADDEDASRFDPDHYVTKMDVFGAWLKLQKLLKNK